MPIRSLAAAAALALVAATPLLAQDAPPAAEQADAQLALATVLTSEDYVAEMFHRSMTVGFDGALRADPEMAQIEAVCPGLIAAMTAAVEPVMWPSHQRDYAAYRTELHALFESELSDEHARGAADFFASPLGRRFMTALSSEMTVDAMLGEITMGEAAHVSSEAMAADTRESVSRGMMALEPADRLEISTILSTNGWATEFARIEPQVAALQLDMANADFSADESAAMDAAIDGVLEEQFATCFPENE
jgi:hypothetical protein